MSGTPAFEEAIRLVLETSGTQGVERLKSALAGLGDVSAETQADTLKLVEQLAALNAAAEGASRFEELTADLTATEAKLGAAETAAYQLTLALAGVEKPTREMAKAQRDAREEVERQRAAYAGQWDELNRLEGELKAAGVNTANLAAVQRDLRNQIGSTAGAIDRQAQSVRNEATAVQQLKQRMAEGDAAFRQQATSSRAAADSLRAYRDRAAEAANETRDLSSAAGALGKLRGVLASVAAYLSFQSAAQGIKNLFGVAESAETARRALGNMYGSQEDGNRVYGEMASLARKNGLAFDAMLGAAKKLKSFGLDPLNGSLQALVDQNAAVGGTQEELEGKVLALGQAWAKQKLQGEEILQLVERGVPVWDLLQKATGKNVDELQKLSSAGALGRDVIAALYEEIGRANAGAAERGLSSLSGLVAQLSARWLEFRQKLVDAGLGDYFKRQLQAMLDATGGMDGLAKRVSDSVVSAMEAIKRLGQQLAPLGEAFANLTLGLAKHAEAVVFLGKVYVGLKIASFASGFLSIASGARAATAATTGLAAAEAARAGSMGQLSGKVSGLASAMARLVPQVALIAAVDFTANSIVKLVDAIGEYQSMLEKTGAYQAQQKAFAQEQITIGQQLQNLYRASADQQIASANELAGKTREQAEAYRYSLQQAQQYFRGVVLEARGAGDSMRAAMAADQARALRDELAKVEAALESLSQKAREQNALRDQAQAAIDKFDELRQKGETVSTAIQNAFDGIDFTSADGLTKASHIMQQMGVRGTQAAEAIQSQLRKALADVSDSDLPRVREAAERAFGQGVAGAEDLAAALDSVNLERLGVNLDVVRTGFSKVGRAAVDQFVQANEEVRRLGLNMEQRSAAISAAFTNAFSKVSTSEEIKALKNALADALSAGNLQYGAFTQAVSAIEGKFAEVSQSAQQMGGAVDSGAAQASSALYGLADAANEAAEASENMAESAEGVAGRFDQLLQANSQMAFSLGEVGDGFRDAMKAMFASAAAGSPVLFQFAAITNELTRQRHELAGLSADLDATASKYDETAKRRAELRAQFSYVSDGELDALIQKETQIDSIRKQRSEERARELEGEQRANEARLAAMKEQQNAQQAAGDAMNSDEQRLVIDWRAPSKGVAASASAAEIEQAERLAELVAPRVLQRIERARSVSILRRGGR